jgi:hypothetical protein
MPDSEPDFRMWSRTKEVAVSKISSANTLAITKLMLRRISVPVLLANAISRPVAYYFLRRRLQGFADHVRLNPAHFLMCDRIALLISWATVFVRTLRLARMSPMHVLRYERADTRSAAKPPARRQAPPGRGDSHSPRRRGSARRCRRTSRMVATGRDGLRRRHPTARSKRRCQHRGVAHLPPSSPVSRSHRCESLTAVTALSALVIVRL